MVVWGRNVRGGKEGGRWLPTHPILFHPILSYPILSCLECSPILYPLLSSLSFSIYPIRCANLYLPSSVLLSYPGKPVAQAVVQYPTGRLLYTRITSGAIASRPYGVWWPSSSSCLGPGLRRSERARGWLSRARGIQSRRHACTQALVLETSGG